MIKLKLKFMKDALLTNWMK